MENWTNFVQGQKISLKSALAQPGETDTSKENGAVVMEDSVILLYNGTSRGYMYVSDQWTKVAKLILLPF